MKTITVSLPDEHAADIEARLAAGEYESWDEAVTIAIAEWLSELAQPPMIDEDDDLRAKIRESITHYAQGRFVDGEEHMDRLDREFGERMSGAVKIP